MSNKDIVGIEGRQLVEFELLDDATKQAVIKCIQEKGRISIVSGDKKVNPKSVTISEFNQLVD